MSFNEITELKTAATPVEENLCLNNAISAINWAKPNAWYIRYGGATVAKGDVVNCPYYKDYELVCTQAGTCSDGLLDKDSIIVGSTIADGTAKWLVRHKRNSEVLGYTTGEISTDEKLYNDLLSRKRSTFDINKFTVVGTPTITEGGIASGFSASNFLKTKDTFNFATVNNWNMIASFEYQTSTEDQAIIVEDNKTSFSGIRIDSTGVVKSVINNGQQTIGVLTGRTKMTVGNKYFAKLEFTGAKYNLYLSTTGNFSGEESLEASVTSSLKLLNKQYTIGASTLSGYTRACNSSIDLKQFSVAVDGVEIFNGNKTGIEQIKSNNYTVVGSPTITDDGIVTFSGSDYLNSGYNLDGTKDWEICCDFALEASSRLEFLDCVNGNFYMSLGIGYNNGILINIGNASHTTWDLSSGWHGTMSLGLNHLKWKYAANTQTYSMYINNNIVWEQVSSVIPIGYVMKIGNNATGGYPARNLDLNSIKIYSDGSLVYQPTLRIPYTQSKTGSKIVDSTYRDRVQDMYEQFGYTPYYTIGDNKEKYNTTTVGAPSLAGGIASDFTDSNYVQVALPFSLIPSTSNAIVEIKGDFIVTSTPSSLAFVLGSNVSGGIQPTLAVNSGLKLLFSLYGATDRYTSESISLNTRYEYKMVLDSTRTWQAYYKQASASEWIYVGTMPFTSTSASSELNGSLYIGRGYQSSKTFTGSVDLSQFSITVDGKEVFRGYQPKIENTTSLPAGDVYGIMETVCAKKDLSNVQDIAQVRAVVQSNKTGTRWERIYDDKWCEQGGSGTGSITFSNEFVDANYTVTTGGIRYSNKTSTSFNMTSSGDWEAKGYIL